MKKILLLISFLFLISEKTIAGQHLVSANQSFVKHDYISALANYKQAIGDLTNQSNPITTTTIFQNLKNKFASALNVFSPSFTSVPTPVVSGNSGSGAIQDVSTYAYICHNMGECYLQQKNITAAVSIWGVGADEGGQSTTGLKCRFKEGQYKMYNHDYQGGYDSFKKYLKAYIQKDKSQYDRPKMSAALYMGSVCAWKLYKSGVPFEKNIADVYTLQNQIMKIVPALDTRLYFNR
jgi:hypothetical protein